MYMLNLDCDCVFTNIYYEYYVSDILQQIYNKRSFIFFKSIASNDLPCLSLDDNNIKLALTIT